MSQFPKISYQEFLSLPSFEREFLASQNRILQTDTYNRTMCYLKQEKYKTVETYTLQFRRAEHGYFVVYGILDQFQKIFRTPITQAELDFAKEFYKQSNVKYFKAEMWQEVIDNHQGFIPLTIEAVPDGTAILPYDPILTVTGPGELAAHFEPDLHRIFYQTAVATKAHLISQTVGPSRFIEVGKRGAINEQMHLQAMAAMYAGGGLNLTSNDSAVASYPFLKDIGTVGHRFLQFCESEDEAFEQAINISDFTILLIDLNNSIQGIDKAIKLKKKYRNFNKTIWIRLDSGQIKEQALYCLSQFKQHGFTDKGLDKIVIEDLSSITEIQEIDKYLSEKQSLPVVNHILYGAGHLLIVDNCTRNATSSAYKLSQIYFENGQIKPTMKFTDSVGKQSLPGKPVLATLEDRRIIIQESEILTASSIFQTVVKDGKLTLEADPEKALLQSQKTFSEIQKSIGSKTELSEKTKQLIQQIRGI